MHESADLGLAWSELLLALPSAYCAGETAFEFQVTEGPSYASYSNAEGAAYKHLPYQLLTVV